MADTTGLHLGQAMVNNPHAPGQESLPTTRMRAGSGGAGLGSGLEQGGELLGVGLGVVPEAVVEQDVGVRLVGQVPDPGCPVLQFGLAVAVAEPLVDVAALP